MTRRKSVSRCARFESLESKQLLAGDVLVSVVDGNLMIHGDELDNQIAVTSGAEPGAFVVTGLHGTNVVLGNGIAVQPPQTEVVVTGVYRGARMSMGDGDDVVLVNKAHFRGNVGIGTGAGNDRVVVGVPMLPVEPRPEVGADSLAVTLDAPSADVPPDPSLAPPLVGIGGSLTIAAGAGEDDIHVGNAAIDGRLSVATGTENDRVLLGNAPLATPTDPPAEASVVPPLAPPQAVLHVGRGIDVQLGEGNDGLTSNRVGTPAGMMVHGGEGDDHVGLIETRVGHLLAVHGGAGEGADHVSIDRVHAGAAMVATGAGHDEARIVDSVFQLLGVDLGGGDDGLSLRGNRARFAVLLGGEGQDSLHGLSENMFSHQFVRGFELPPV
jgi:hypothetical protein